jgi:hypothetical protein
MEPDCVRSDRRDRQRVEEKWIGSDFFPVHASATADIKLHEERCPRDQNQKERQPEQEELSVEVEAKPDRHDLGAEHQRRDVNQNVDRDEKE